MNIKTQKGFTLIELIVVTAVISLLSSIVISFIGAANTKASDTGNIRALQEVKTALNVYFNDNSGGNGSYPKDISILVNKYISSIDKNIKYGGIDCDNNTLCKNYKLAVPLKRKDNKISYGTKSDCNSIEITTNICYFISSNNTHLADLPYLKNNNLGFYVSPIDNSAGIVWDNNDKKVYIDAWNLDDGKWNTNQIINTLGSYNLFAAGLCYNIVLDGYDDWYLPSVNQLKVIYQSNSHITDSGWQPLDKLNGYWSSTETSTSNAYYANATNNYTVTKSSIRKVRCVR